MDYKIVSAGLAAAYCIYGGVTNWNRGNRNLAQFQVVVGAAFLLQGVFSYFNNLNTQREFEEAQYNAQFPCRFVTTDQITKACVAVLRKGTPQSIEGNPDIPSMDLFKHLDGWVVPVMADQGNHLACHAYVNWEGYKFLDKHNYNINKGRCWFEFLLPNNCTVIGVIQPTRSLDYLDSP